MIQARCKRCKGTHFITDKKVICALCNTEYPFSFICEDICETKADDLVILINEGY
jgi:hypothetical protein